MNGDALKEFMFKHFEKFIFGVLTLLALFLIYEGVNKPDILATYQPKAMEDAAVTVKTSIDDDHWAAIAEPRIPTIDVVARTNETRKPVVADPYKPLKPWVMSAEDLSVKRTDPKIPAPIDLRVTGVLASLAVKSPVKEYPLSTLEPAEPVEVVEAPKPKPKRGRAAMMEAMMMGGGGSEMMMDPSMMDPAMMGRGGSPSSSSMMDPSMLGTETGMPGMAPAKPIRTLDSKLNLGYVTTAMGQSSTPIAPTVGHFIAGVALMPQKEIYVAFDQAFKQADGYNPTRDVPYFMGLQVQRADVTDKPVEQLTEADWVVRGSSRYYQQLLLRYWAGMNKEVVAGKYRDPELTTAIPPVLLESYMHFVTHPKIPVGDEPLPGTVLPAGAQPEAAPVGPIIPGAGDADPIRNRGRAGGAGGPGSAYGAPMAADMGYNSYAGMGGNMAINVTALQPDYKLIRFYDFRDFTGKDLASPQPGRKYVYRIRIAVEDPNFPTDPLAQPRNGTLAAEVFRRVSKLTAQAAADTTKGRVSTLWSEYSAPSPAVSLPGIHDSYAGPVDPGATKVYQVNNSPVEFQSKPPKGKVVVTQWDPLYGAPLPVFMEVTKGSVVSKKGTVEVPDPLTLQIRKVPDATINTSNVVLDLAGGKPLTITTVEEQTEPGVLLMFDPNGGLEVVDEIDTQRGYRMYSYADERGEE
jgi:hypothetical protein